MVVLVVSRLAASYSYPAEAVVVSSGALSASVVNRSSGSEDRFGEQLAIGDINGDDTGDLVVATIGEQISGSSNRGSVHVLYGPVGEAPAAGGRIDSGSIDGIGEFAGSAPAPGCFDDDGVDDLIAGMRSEAIGSVEGAGASLVLFGNATGGLSSSGAIWIDQDTEGVPVWWSRPTTSAGPSALPGAPP